MKEYNLLESDYNKTLCKNREEVLKKAKQNNALLKECMESDLFLNQLEEARRLDFFAFAFNCNMVAAQAQGEISVALEPDSKSANVVIVSQMIELRHPVRELFAHVVGFSDYFSAEPVEEDGAKLVMYFHFLF